MKIPYIFTKNVSLLSLPILIALNTLSIGSVKAIGLINPSFEENLVDNLGALSVTSTPATTSGRIEPATFNPTGANFVTVTENNINGWGTDATNRGIEIWESGFNAGGGTANVLAAPDNGNQFAELNATQPTALSQDLPIAASLGTTQLYFSFWHRARAVSGGQTAINAVRVRIFDGATVVFNKVFATQLVDGAALTNNGWARYTSSDFAAIIVGSGAARNITYQFSAELLSGGSADIFSTTGASPTRTFNATGISTTNNADLSFGNFIDAANLSDNPATVGVPFDFEANVGIGILGALYFGRKAFKSWKNKKDNSGS